MSVKTTFCIANTQKPITSSLMEDFCFWAKFQYSNVKLEHAHVTPLSMQISRNESSDRNGAETVTATRRDVGVTRCLSLSFWVEKTESTFLMVTMTMQDPRPLLASRQVSGLCPQTYCLNPINLAETQSTRTLDYTPPFTHRCTLI